MGGVMAYEGHVSVSGVGFDIGCGNLAARLDVKKSEIEDRVGTIARDIAGNVSFGLGRANAEKVEHPLFDDEEAWNAPQSRTSRRWRATSWARWVPATITSICSRT